MSKSKIATVPSHSFEPTSDPNIQRFCDSNGDWTHYWLVKEKKFVPAVNHILETGHAKGPNFAQYLLRSTQEEVKKKLEEKGDEGSRTHKAIEDLISGLKVTMSTKYPTDLHDGRQTILTADEWDNLQGFINWAQRYQPRVVAHEDTLATNQYAGTMDALLVITIPAGDKDFDKAFWGKDVLILIDWKSSASVWMEYEAQTAAYFNPAKKKYAKFFKAYEGRVFTGVVRLGTRHKTKYEFVWWTQKQTEGEHWLRFEAASLISKRYESDYEPVIEQIPTQFFIKVPLAKVVATRKAKVSKN